MLAASKIIVSGGAPSPPRFGAGLSEARTDFV
jgi:hypothetical protein